MRLVVSDDPQGLTGAIAAVLPGCAWQRCRTHFMRNVLCRVPRSAQPFVATLVRTIFAQPSAEEVEAQLKRVIAQLESRLPEVARRWISFGCRRLRGKPMSKSPGRRYRPSSWEHHSQQDKRRLQRYLPHPDLGLSPCAWS